MANRGHTSSLNLTFFCVFFSWIINEYFKKLWWLQKHEPVDNLKKYKIEHILKSNILKTQNTSKKLKVFILTRTPSFQDVPLRNMFYLVCDGYTEGFVVEDGNSKNNRIHAKNYKLKIEKHLKLDERKVYRS